MKKRPSGESSLKCCSCHNYDNLLHSDSEILLETLIERNRVILRRYKIMREHCVYLTLQNANGKKDGVSHLGCTKNTRTQN